MSVAGDRVYLQGARGSNSVIALNRADGKDVWSKPLGPDEEFVGFYTRRRIPGCSVSAGSSKPVDARDEGRASTPPMD